MRYIIFSLIAVSVFFVPAILAQDITLSLDQSEYYFRTGEDAVIDLITNSTYDDKTNGILSYTITQEINQGNFQYKSSNTKSTSFSVDSGDGVVPMSFGTSDTPLTLDVKLKFSYTKKEPMVVDLDNIKIHFVSDDSQKKNSQNQVSSSSKRSSGSSQQSNDPFAQQEQKMQQMINQMMGNQQQPQQPQQQRQTTEQKLQNNQLSQDSSALKKQMKQQIQEQKQMRDEFQKMLSQNEKFQKEHQKMLDSGYNLTDANFNPLSNDTGDFELEYQKPDGSKASLKGQMNNGNLQNLQKDSAESRQQALDRLRQDEKFQKFQKELQEQGYAEHGIEFSQENNRTDVRLNYVNQNNETATIAAQISNDSVEDVRLDKGKEEKRNYMWIFLILLSAIVAGYYAYRMLYKKSSVVMDAGKKKNIVFDHKKESLKLLEKSKELFEKKKFKDAYGTAGQALRLFLSYDNNLNKEITNDEIIDYLRKHKKNYKKAKECFDMCSLVEFAKYKPDKRTFEKIIRSAEEIIR